MTTLTPSPPATGAPTEPAFRLLGDIAVVRDATPVNLGGARQRRLLAMLLVHRNHVVSADRLIDSVFAGEPTAGATTTLRSYVARLRKSIGPDLGGAELRTVPPGYLLAVADDLVDAARFERLLEQGQRELAAGDAVVATATLRGALALWRGPAFGELADEPWAEPEAQRLDELRLVAGERSIDAALACGLAAEAIADLDALIAAHPLREAFRAQQMLALYRTGRHVEASRAFRSYRALLDEEIGLEPSASLVDLDRRIIDQDPTLDLAAPAGQPLRGYRLGARLGSGPNGVRHEAVLPGIDGRFEIAIATGDHIDTAEFIAAFDAAGQRLVSVRHPAIESPHDVWREPGRACVVTRPSPHPTLRHLLEVAPPDPPAMVRIARRIGDALIAAHQRGIVHGAVGVDGVVVAAGGSASLVDFCVPPPVGAGVADDATGLANVLAATAAHQVDGERADRIADALYRAASLDDGAVGAVVEAWCRALDETVPVPTERPNPFKGLRPFDEADAADFFGRDGVVDAIVDRVASPDTPFTLVVGPSGSGKSSLVRAGVVPRIRASGPAWLVTTMLPGATPFKELAEALRAIARRDSPALADELADAEVPIASVVERILPPGIPALVVIDQFEEVFTLNGDDVARSFCSRLVELALTTAAVRVVATMRADFYDRPLGQADIGQLVATSTVTLPAMAPVGLEAAIVGPLASIGATAESAAVAELVAAVADQPAALPSLQFALFELAARDPVRNVTLDGYRALGGVDGAIAARAEQLYGALDPARRGDVRLLFEQLVTIDADGEVTGRRASRVELNERLGRVDDVIDEWVAARLLTTDRDPRSRVPTVEIAHEALIGAWPRLAGWLDEDAAVLAATGALRQAAEAWAAEGRDEAALYRGGRLENALALTTGSTLSATEREYLDAAVAARDREADELRERADRQARTNRRLRVQLSVIAVALVVALVGGFVALRQRSDAQDAQGEAVAAQADALSAQADAVASRDDAESALAQAEAAERFARARGLAAAADASLDVDAERSVLLAREAVREARDGAPAALEAARRSLHEALRTSRAVLTIPGEGGWLDWSPDGSIIVTEGPEDRGLVNVLDAMTGEVLRSWRGDAVDINEVIFSPDGRYLATSGDEERLRIWDPATGELVVELPGVGVPYSLSFSADGSRFAAGWNGEGGAARVVEVPSGRVISTIDRNMSTVALSPDGTRVTGWEYRGPGVPGEALVFDAATGEVTMTLDDAGFRDRMKWSPDGTMIAAGGEFGEIRVWDASTGGTVRLAANPDTNPTGAIDWFPDSDGVVVGGSFNGVVQVWEFDGSGALRERLRLIADELGAGIADVALSPGGDRVAVGSWEVEAVKVFDLRPSGTAEVVATTASPDWWDAWFIDDERLLVTEPGVLGVVRDVADGSDVRRIGSGELYPFALSPDRSTMVAGSPEQYPVTFHDLDSGEVIAEWSAPRADVSIRSGRFSPDGSRFALADRDDGGSWITVLDRDGNVIAEHPEPGFEVRSVAPLRDGRVAFTRFNVQRAEPQQDRLSIWDPVTGDVERLPFEAELIAVDPSSERLVASVVRTPRAVVVDLESGEQVSELVGHTGTISWLEFSDDGSMIATTSGDGTARVWDAATGAGIVTFRHDGGRLSGAGFSPDGRRLVSVEDGGEVRVWALSVDELLEIADRRVTRDFTDAECRQYLDRAAC